MHAVTRVMPPFMAADVAIVFLMVLFSSLVMVPARRFDQNR
jgi:hypothetical protein